jgi:hypothetical protein
MIAAKTDDAVAPHDGFRPGLLLEQLQDVKLS